MTSSNGAGAGWTGLGSVAMVLPCGTSIGRERRFDRAVARPAQGQESAAGLVRTVLFRPKQDLRQTSAVKRRQSSPAAPRVTRQRLVAAGVTEFTDPVVRATAVSPPKARTARKFLATKLESGYLTIGRPRGGHYNPEMADRISCSCVTCPKCGTWVALKELTAVGSGKKKFRANCPAPECGKEFEFEASETWVFEVPVPVFERRHFFRSELR